MLFARTLKRCFEGRLRLQVSLSKTNGLASTAEGRKALLQGLAPLGYKISKGVRQLGLDFSAGASREAVVRTRRLDSARARVPRFAWLRSLGYRVAPVIRSGLIMAQLWAASVFGISDTELSKARRTTALALSG